MRRHYTIGRCQDCGWEKRTTVVIFWVNGMRYRVCAGCRRAYDGVILKACAKDCATCQTDAV